PTECHVFNTFFYEENQDTRTVAIIAYYDLDATCPAQTSDVFEETFKFKPLEQTTYLFRFWNGQDDEGLDVYTEYEVQAFVNFN
ncbi:MAG: hypothetical protein HRT68_03015, partial [Flavobacteriaceae bacterium]|nr:hypothetical protein [Flavobacteriaceae bacterium]